MNKKAVELAWTYIAIFLLSLLVLIFIIIFYSNIGQGIKDTLADFFSRIFSF